MVDYSKWNNFAADHSDSDEEFDSKPRVTKLESNEKIQIGPNGAKVCKTLQIESSAPHTSNIESTGAGSRQNDYNLTQFENCFWKQNRYEAEIVTILPPETRASEVSLQYEDTDKKLIINLGSHSYLIGNLQYPIQGNKVEEFDWEVKTEGQLRKLYITFQKISPIPNATIWWKVFFKGDPEIDVTKISGRNVVQKSVWEEAHAAFKEKISNFERIEITEDTET